MVLRALRGLRLKVLLGDDAEASRREALCRCLSIASSRMKWF